MKPEQVKAYFGSTYKFHKETGMSSTSLLNWIEWGYVPLESQYRLEKFTYGGLKAEWDDHDA